MYHSIGPKAKSEIGAGIYSVSEERFKEQMGHLFFQQSNAVITFDDGCEDNYAVAYPILQGFNRKAYFFILVSNIGTSGYMDWRQIQALKDAGMTIGSHGMTHRILTDLSNDQLDYELRESKNILEDNLKCCIDNLSIPRGFYNTRVIDRAIKAGYKTIFTSNPKDRSSLKFGRIAIKGNWDLDYFEKALNGRAPLREKGTQFIINSTKKVLGARNYDRIRTAVLKR